MRDGAGLEAAALKRVRGAAAMSRDERDAAIAAIAELRETMSADVGVVRHRRGLTRALLRLAELAERADGDVQLSNMLLTARLVTASALLRTESRGGHYRSDYPAADAALAHRSFITVAELETLEAHVMAHAVARNAEAFLACDAEVSCAP